MVIKGLSLNHRRIELGMVNMKRCLATNENLLYSSGNSKTMLCGDLKGKEVQLQYNMVRQLYSNKN